MEIGNLKQNKDVSINLLLLFLNKKLFCCSPERKEHLIFAFIDADKENYVNYHERLIKLVKIGGLLVYDNTLWGGRVVMREEDVVEQIRPSRKAVLEFNKALSKDSRLEIGLTSVGDGLTICRRIL